MFQSYLLRISIYVEMNVRYAEMVNTAIFQEEVFVAPAVQPCSKGKHISRSHFVSRGYARFILETRRGSGLHSVLVGIPRLQNANLALRNSHLDTPPMNQNSLMTCKRNIVIHFFVLS